MRTSTWFILFVFFLLSGVASAQVSQVRYEMPLLRNQSEPYMTTSLRENGILIYNGIIIDNQNAIQVHRVDTTFTEVWKGFIKLDRTMNLVSSYYLGGFVFMLLKDKFNPLAEFQIVTIEVNKGTYGTFNVKTLIPFIPTHFQVTAEAAVIGGTFNYRPLVLYYNFQLRQSKILPGFFNEPGDLNQVRTDNLGNIDIVVAAKNHQRKRSLWIRNYDRLGELTKTIVLQPDDEKNLIFGRSVSQANGEQIVSGVYGRYTDYSRGIFIANIDAEGGYKIKYYNFGDLQRFFSYMKVRREQRIKHRIERRKVKGKKLRFNYRLLVTELIPYGNDQYVMMGEAFYPHYAYPSASTRGFGGYYNMNMRGPFVGSSRGDLVFDGYQYTHAVVVGFDKSGKVLWDNSFEINDVKTFELEQFVKLAPQKERMSLLYLFDNVIRSKLIKDSDVVEGKTYAPLAMYSKNDHVRERDTQKARLEYWYGDVFYATGIQNIRNQPKAEGISRRVFFINKIVHK